MWTPVWYKGDCPLVDTVRICTKARLVLLRLLLLDTLSIDIAIVSSYVVELRKDMEPCGSKSPSQLSVSFSVSLRTLLSNLGPLTDRLRHR